MSDTPERPPQAGANPDRVPVEAAVRDDRESPPGEFPEPEGPFHLNEYLANRAFGGSEEGGWWYDTGTFVACHGVFATPDEAAAVRDAMAPRLAERRRGLRDPSSVLCTGWPVIHIEPHAGADFPKVRPRYE